MFPHFLEDVGRLLHRDGELGLTYPIMRGFAPLLVALASSAFIGEAPSFVSWLGIVGITVWRGRARFVSATVVEVEDVGRRVAGDPARRGRPVIDAIRAV